MKTIGFVQNDEQGCWVWQLPLFGWVQAPALHTSFVHELPSSGQLAVLFGWVQAPALHTSFVQTLPSSVHAVPFATGLFWQNPEAQVSCVHALLSLHCAALLQDVARGLSAGPVPVGVKLPFVVKKTLSKTKPSSRIQMLMVWRPVLVTLIVATGPSIVDRLQVSPVPKELMRSAEVGPVLSIPAWQESPSAFGPMPRTQTL